MNGESQSLHKPFGKYRLIAHVATGGMADIYLAAHTGIAGFEKLVIIKRILPNLARDPNFVQMFLDEARIAATLNHPNVVQIFDLGVVEGHYFIAMEYLHGESLSALIKKSWKKRGKIPHELAAGIILHAAEGLHHAHTMNRNGKPLGIVHRDVTPQNIIVLYDGGVKLVDFGIAKAVLRDTQTRTGVLKGKFAYMSPEQILGMAMDGRSDVFSLGVVLWESLVGRKLFNQTSDLELLQAVTMEDATSPSEHAPGIPGELDAITLKALARKHDERYQSAADLRMALREYLKNSGGDWDSVAIGRFMQDLFSDKITKKRSIIDSARAAEQDTGDYLFGEMDALFSDTDTSVPYSTPNGNAAVRKETVSKRRSWRRLLSITALVVAALAAVGIAIGSLSSATSEGGAISTMGKQDPVGSNTPATASTPSPPPVIRADPGKSADPNDELATKTETNDASAKRKKRRKGFVRWLDEIAKPRPTGKIFLTTVPWTEVYYRGRRLGQTPLVNVRLPAGRIKLRVVNANAGINRKITVRIRPGKTTKSRFDLSR